MQKCVCVVVLIDFTFANNGSWLSAIIYRHTHMQTYIEAMVWQALVCVRHAEFMYMYSYMRECAHKWLSNVNAAGHRSTKTHTHIHNNAYICIHIHIYIYIYYIYRLSVAALNLPNQNALQSTHSLICLPPTNKRQLQLQRQRQQLLQLHLTHFSSCWTFHTHTQKKRRGGKVIFAHSSSGAPHLKQMHTYIHIH